MAIQTGQQILAADVLNLGGYAAEVNVQTLSAGKTLVNADKFYQFLNPGGASRIVTLPAAGAGNHPFTIVNTASADEVLTVKNASSVIIGYVWRGQAKTFISDGTNWLLLDYSTEILRYVPSDFSKTSDITLANIPGLSANVVSGGIYRIISFLMIQNGASGGTKVTISGTATATASRFRVSLEGASATTLINMNTMDTATGETAAHQTVRVEGYIQVNAGGTLTLQMAQNASNATATTVRAGSWFQVDRMA